MYPASFAAIVMPRARMVFAGRVQIEAACSMALCCTLDLPIPFHDRCTKPLLALFRSDVLATDDGLRRCGRSLVGAALCDNLRYDRPPLWILADPPWHIDAVEGRSHHQSRVSGIW